MSNQYAKYYNPQHNFETIDKTEGFMEENEEYIRLTEPVEINFTRLPETEINNEKIKRIDEEIKKTYLAAEVQVQNLNDIKQKLLALPAKTPEE